jgi:hypothetical protein
MAEKQKTTLKTHINADLADNNAGLISADDVRHNLIDTVDSINYIVASGDTENKYKFVYNVKASTQNGIGTGFFITESGITFDNDHPNAGNQYEPYPGPGGIEHNDLAGLNTDDPHLQYFPVDGSRPMEGDLPMATYWLGASGYSNHGLKFVHRYADDPTGTVARNDIHVGNSGDFVFHDSSRFNSAQGIAKAWVSFDGTTTSPTISGHYNVTSITDVGTGKYVITFAHDVLGGNNYAAIANSNARSTNSSSEDFERNTVGLTVRDGDGGTPRTLSYVVLNESVPGYTDSRLNDLVVFGLGSGVTMA